jgi:hypothetical protein
MHWYKVMSIKWLKLNPEWNRKLLWCSALTVGGALYFKAWLPLTHIGIPCVFHEITGLYCPGCGMTRTTLAMLNMDVYQALRYNPLVFTLIPLYLAYMVAVRNGKVKFGKTIMLTMLALTLLFGLLRNIPLFDWLAPVAVT